MPTLDITNFRGQIPKIADRSLPAENAVKALECRFESGELEAWNELKTESAVLTSNPETIFLYEDTHWFSWDDVVHAIKSPIAQDVYARVYFTGTDKPRVTSNLIATGGDPKPTASYDLGVPAPDAAVGLSVDNAGADPTETSDDETRYYWMTYVTEYGEEGPPSPTSVSVEVLEPGNAVTVTLPIPVSNTSNITHKRIYRSATGGDGTSALFVAEVTLATTQYVDTLTGEQLGRELDTVDFEMPPSNMQGIVAGSNGIVAGFAGNEVLFSEPYLPYAYPTAYRRSTEHDIVAIAATTTGFVCGTEGYPYIYTGVIPDSMSEQRLEVRQACVSGRSMVDMGAYVIYASPDGLVAVSESRAEVLTKELISKRSWEQYQPDTIHAYLYEDQYIAFYGDDSNGGGFIFDPSSGEFTELDFYASAGYTDLKTDTLYLVVNDQLMSWDNETGLRPFLWRSKIFETPTTSFACARIHTDGAANTGFTLYADGAKVFTTNALTNEVFRLPPVRAREWQFELFGTSNIQRVTLAHSMSELT